jgi:hypothetical protein
MFVAFIVSIAFVVFVLLYALLPWVHIPNTQINQIKWLHAASCQQED